MVDIWSAGTSTVGRIGVNTSRSGRIDRNGDIDWLRINLRHGYTYTFAAVGHTLQDTFLEIYNHSGVRLTYNDDYLGSLDSGLALRAPYTGAYYVAVSSSLSVDTGTYGVSVRTFFGKQAAPSLAIHSAPLQPANRADGLTQALTDLDAARSLAIPTRSAASGRTGVQMPSNVTATWLTTPGSF